MLIIVALSSATSYCSGGTKNGKIPLLFPLGNDGAGAFSLFSRELLVLCLSKDYASGLDSVSKASLARRVANSRGGHGPLYGFILIMEVQH